MRLQKRDREEATRILEEEKEKALNQPIDSSWVYRIEEVCGAIDHHGKTIVAMLGTAILAKALNINLDPLSLQEGADREGAYSARSLCQHVLAANAPRLQIDLGVTGREPLNNQPFFGKSTVYDAASHAHSQSKEAMELLVQALEDLARIEDPDEARLVLRAFLQVRQKRQPDYDAYQGAGQHLTRSQFIAHLFEFVRTDSESGKRAQAVGAGLLDVIASSDRVEVGGIHDPDRRFPGDIGVRRLATETELSRAFEVRDKPVEEHDLYHLVEKSAEAGVSKVGMLAVAEAQVPFDLDNAQDWADDRGVMLVVYFDWPTFIKQILFWSDVSEDALVQLAFDRVLQRLKELEVSEEGIIQWGSMEK